MKIELERFLQECQRHVGGLNRVDVDRNAVLGWFQRLCECLTKVILALSHYRKENKEEVAPIQNTLLLYLTQTLTTLALAINVFVKEEGIGACLTEARNCVVKQLNCCLDSFSITFESKAGVKDPSGNFVKWMDAALDKITEIVDNKRAFPDAQKLFEEVLSHAMSIAQVSLTEDSKIIRGSCQSVLGALRSIQNEIEEETPNGAMLNLFINSSSDKLCLLEKKVNTAVLRLCLKTFANFEEPLKKIHRFCSNGNNRRQDEKFDGLIAEFDLHVDRIMQIGLFAVSCSSDSARGVKIRSCLASLEALECELVPNLSSVLLDRSLHNINCANILMNHWLNQALSLQHLIFLIIDPLAFCQVIYEEVGKIVDNLVQKAKFDLRQYDVNDFIKVVKVLHVFLQKTVDEFDENETKNISSHINDLSNVIKEVECASKVLLNENSTVDGNKRVLKRCKILQTLTKRIWYCFMEDSSANKTPTKIEKSPQPELLGNVFLDHIINRGKQILQDRSILYKTPIKSVKTQKKLTLSKLVPLRNLSFMNGSTCTSLDLQITDILNEMTNLSTTISKMVIDS